MWSTRTSWFPRYKRASQFPLFLLGLAFILAFGVTVTEDSSPEQRRVASIIIVVTWIAFGLDYALGLLLTDKHLEYVRTNLMQGVALVFPPLRVLLIGHIFRMLKDRPGRRGDRFRTYLLYVTALTLVVGAVMVVYFEAASPEANINTIGDAIWWGGETVSTVGYGDYYPVTVGGRLVAAGLFVNGVALLSIITAGLAQNFTSDDARSAKSARGVVETHAAAPAPAVDDAPVGVGRGAAEEDVVEVARLLADVEASVAELRAKLTKLTAASQGASSDTDEAVETPPDTPRAP